MRATTWVAAMLLAGTAVAPAWAAQPEDPPATGDDADAAATEPTTLDAVVVTARKKSEPLQHVPASVDAVEARELQARAIDNLTDLADHVPGMQQQDLAITSRLSLRGVASGDNNAFEQSVGVYVDGLYRGRMNQQHIGLFDLERVEVLYGPQVALYGNSSIGGAISAVTRKPSFDAGGQISARYEFEYREPRIEAGFDVPVSDTLAFRIAGKWRDQGKGNFPNDHSGDTEPATDEAAFRLGGLWQANEDWKVALRHEQGRMAREGHLFDVYKHVDGQGHPWPGSTFTGIDNERLDAGNGDPFKYQDSFLRTDMDETQLDIQHRAGAWTFTSVSGHSRYRYRQSLDVDISPATLVNVYQDENYRQLSQELRAAGPLGDRFDLLAGVYWQSDHFRNDYLSDFNLPALLAPAFGVPQSLIDPLIDPFTRHILLDQDTRQWAVFANLDIAFSDSVTGNVGFRYLTMTKDAEQAVRTASIDHVDGPGALVDIRWLNPSLAALLLGNPDYYADPTHYLLVLPDGTTVAPVLAPQHLVGYSIVSAGAGVPHEFTGLSRREHHPMLHAGVAWQPTDDLLLYANWDNGAKAGGFDFNYEGGDRDAAEYAPEKASVFELGMKKDWRDVRLNLAVFHGRYSDLQVSVYDGGIGFVVGNAASSVSQGLDAEVVWRFAEGWRVGGQFEWLDFHYDDFATANCSTTDRLNGSGPICDWSGDRTPFVPEFEGALTLDHTRTLGGDWTLQQGLRWSYKSSHTTASDNEPQTVQGGYHLLDYRLELSPAGRAWSLAIAGRNLTDERYNVFTSVIPLAPGGAFANVQAKGRELALEWRVRF